MSKILEKAIALILVILLTSANVFMLGEYTIAYALSDEELNKQDSSTNNKNVEFNAYFEGEVHNKIFEINSENAKLFLKIAVNNVGYLESGTIEFQNSNFKLKEGISNEYIQSVDVENNKILLNKINKGTNITIEIPIEILRNDTVSIDYFNKETITKFTGTYIDGTGNEKSIEKEVTNKLSWKGTAEAEINVETTKYIPYKDAENYGVLVQTKINSKVKNSSLPIKNTNIQVTVPTINNVKPTTATVIATKMEATNGETDGLNFNNNNYKYDVENGVVTIITSNKVDNNISWKQNGQDEYLITYLFEGEEIYNYIIQNGMNSNTNVVVTMNLYNNEETTIKNSVNLEMMLSEKIGELTNFSIEATDNISKGYIYANYNTNNKIETEYYTKYKATIDSSKILKSIEFLQEYDKFLTANNAEGSTTVGNNNNAYNKKIEISQAIFNKILGEEGNITVKNENGTEIGVINKDTKVENGLYSLDISQSNSNKISLKTSEPITEGQLEITIVKAIKGKLDYSKEQMESFVKIKESLSGKTNMAEAITETQTQLSETELKAELQIDKKDWTTAMKNENVEIKTILDTSSEYNALYKDPIIQIEFPEVVDKIDVKNLKLLYTDELKIKESKFESVNGKYILNIILEGTQTKYNIGEPIKGINIVINADITLKEKISTQETEVKMYYMNNAKSSTYAINDEETKKESVVKVNAISQTGIITESGINNIKTNTNISSTKDEKVEGTINTYVAKRTATVYGKIINSYNNSINNLVILGRVPAEGNKKIDTEESLGSNINLTMLSQISIVGLSEGKYQIYYSENINATNNINEGSNGWTSSPSNLTNVKSYMIVFQDYEITQGKEIQFKYDVEIPENLEHEKTSYQMYKIYYNNVTTVGTLPETKLSPIVGVTTGEEPKLEVELSSSFAQNSEVREGQIVKFLATIKNTSGVKAEGVNLYVTAPDGTVHTIPENNGYEYKDLEEKDRKINVGTIEPGNSKEIYFELKMTTDLSEVVKKERDKYVSDKLSEASNPDNIDIDKLVEEANNLYNIETYKMDIVFHVGITTAENKTQKISNEYSIKKTKGSITMLTTPSKSQGTILKSGDTIEISTKIRCLNQETIKNVKIEGVVPEGIKIEDAYILKEDIKQTEGINKDNNKLQINISELKKEDGIINIVYYIKIENYTGKLQTLLTANGEGISTQYSNEVIHRVENIKIEINQTSPTPQYVLEGDNIVYNFTVKNIGLVQASNVTIEEYIPEGLEFVNAKYEYHNASNAISSNNNGILKIFLFAFESGATCNITVTLKSKMLYEDTTKEVTNYAKVKVNGMNDVESNKITNYIEYDPEQHIPEEGGGSSTQRRYSISGYAWNDSNKDGKRDEGEEMLSNIDVYLVYKANGVIVQDKDSGSDKITKTDSNGKYEFSNLQNDQYLVVFGYDAARYNITQYQAQGVNESLNSDAILAKINIQGEEKIAGVTDTINISNRHIRNIDLGLYVSEKFDLRLDKYVSKITLTTPTIGTKSYTHNNQLAKVEILGQNLGKSSIAIEYKIVIKNEGAISGYAKKIVDYLPKNAKFNSEINTDWYLSDDGNVYNASLANVKINPGESKEVTLVLTKQIDELEIVYNSAEIYEAYNEQGQEDMDSTEANKNENEDDYSKAEVVISLVTGKIITYTILALVIIAMLGIGIYEIKKRVLNKRK